PYFERSRGEARYQPEDHHPSHRQSPPRIRKPPPASPISPLHSISFAQNVGSGQMPAHDRVRSPPERWSPKETTTMKAAGKNARSNEAHPTTTPGGSPRPYSKHGL